MSTASSWGKSDASQRKRHVEAHRKSLVNDSAIVALQQSLEKKPSNQVQAQPKGVEQKEKKKDDDKRTTASKWIQTFIQTFPAFVFVLIYPMFIIPLYRSDSIDDGAYAGFAFATLLICSHISLLFLSLFLSSSLPLFLSSSLPLFLSSSLPLFLFSSFPLFHFSTFPLFLFSSLCPPPRPLVLQSVASSFRA